MQNRIAALGAAAALGFILTGCAATGPRQEEAAPAVREEVRQEAAGPATVQDPCAEAIEAVVRQARTSMKTVKETCGDRKIRANPMWDMDYDGKVRLMIYDAAGRLVLDEFRKP